MLPSPGYTPPPDTLTIRFPEASPYAGAVVRALRRASVAQVMEWDRLRREEPADPETERTIYDAIREFGERFLTAWNLREPHVDPDAAPAFDEDGTPVPVWVKDAEGAVAWFPVPPTAEALMRMPYAFAIELLTLHAQEVSGVAGPLSTASSATPPSPAEPSTPKRARPSRSPQS